MNTSTAKGVATSQELAGVAWRTSTRSVNGGGQCVEAGPVTDGTGRVAVRHSHHPDGAALVVTGDEWATFLTGLKHGAFDP